MLKLYVFCAFLLFMSRTSETRQILLPGSGSEALPESLKSMKGFSLWGIPRFIMQTGKMQMKAKVDELENTNTWDNRFLKRTNRIKDSRIRILKRLNTIKDSRIRILKRPNMMKDSRIRILKRPNMMKDSRIRILKRFNIIQECRIGILNRPKRI